MKKPKIIRMLLLALLPNNSCQWCTNHTSVPTVVTMQLAMTNWVISSTKIILHRISMPQKLIWLNISICLLKIMMISVFTMNVTTIISIPISPRNQRNSSQIKRIRIDMSKALKPSIRLRCAKTGSLLAIVPLKTVVHSLTGLMNYILRQTFPETIRLSYVEGSMKICIVHTVQDVNSFIKRKTSLSKNSAPFLRIPKSKQLKFLLMLKSQSIPLTFQMYLK